MKNLEKQLKNSDDTNHMSDNNNIDNIVNVKSVSEVSTANTDSSQLQAQTSLHSNKLMRWLFVFLGCVVFAIGIVGIVVPLLPTTPLVILAAAFWAKGSQRFHDWILAHPVFGKMVLDWRNRQAIPKYAKYLAWSMMTLSCGMIFYRMPPDWQWIGWVSAVFSLSVAIWMARLPDA